MYVIRWLMVGLVTCVSHQCRGVWVLVWCQLTSAFGAVRAVSGMFIQSSATRGIMMDCGEGTWHQLLRVYGVGDRARDHDRSSADGDSTCAASATLLMHRSAFSMTSPCVVERSPEALHATAAAAPASDVFCSADEVCLCDVT